MKFLNNYWIAKKCSTDINGVQRMNPNDSANPLTLELFDVLYLAPAGQNFHLLREIYNNNIQYELAQILYRHSWSPEDDSY